MIAASRQAHERRELWIAPREGEFRVPRYLLSFVCAIVATACGRNPTGSPARFGSVYVRGLVADSAGIPVSGATVELTFLFPSASPVDTLRVGDCVGVRLFPAATLQTGSNGAFSQSFSWLSSSPACAAALATPPPTSTLAPATISHPDLVFGIDQARTDTATFTILLPRKK